jgi:phage terminase large subunit
VLRDLFDRCEPEIVIAGPAGTGKSMACLEQLHLAALAKPGMRGLIVRKTLVSLGSTALVTWRERVVREALLSGVVRFYGGSPQESPQYTYRNGSVIVIGGMDRAIRIMSSEYDMIYVQEATELSEDDWEALTTRLRHGVMKVQQIIADCNPGQPTHWLKARADRGATLMLESRHEDNPTLFDTDGTVTEAGQNYIAKLDALTGVRYLRLRRGIWAAAEGLVFDDYDPAVHLVDQFDIPYEWPRYWSVDFGFIHPFVCQFWALDPDGRAFLYREVYRSRRTVDQHAADILDACTEADPTMLGPTDGRAREPAWVGRFWSEPKPSAIICDHDAEGRAVLERELGMSTTAATKSVLEGIQAVQTRLRPAGDGKARIFLVRDAVVYRDPELADAKKPCSTTEEILGYVWDTGGGRKPKEAPLKLDDDGCDAMRYFVADRDLGSRPGVRFL